LTRWQPARYNQRMHPRRAFVALIVATLTSTSIGAAGQQPRPLQPPQEPDKWEPAIQKFEEQDKQNPPPKHGIVFVGASSIVRWNLAEWFPDVKDAVNRGFGGSEMADSAKYAGRVVVPYAPRTVVLYPGENDIARGTTPQTVGAGFVKFYQTVHSALPNTRIIVIGLKPTPARWHLNDKFLDANNRIRSYCQSHSQCIYLDVTAAMLGPDGTPKPELFISDGQHMTPAGYKIWTALIRPRLQLESKN
jgi:lysophospholipase L1-like esterase